MLIYLDRGGNIVDFDLATLKDDIPFLRRKLESFSRFQITSGPYCK
jgi:hypothetical protein